MGCRADRYADANLASPLLHRIGKRSVNALNRDEESTQSEDGQYNCVEALLCHRCRSVLSQCRQIPDGNEWVRSRDSGAHGFRELFRVARSAYDESPPANPTFGMLVVRYIDRWLVAGPEVARSSISGYSDNSHPLGSARGPHPLDPVIDRRLARPQLSSERLIHYRDGYGVLIVGAGE
jgi:hypothetical protein